MTKNLNKIITFTYKGSSNFSLKYFSKISRSTFTFPKSQVGVTTSHFGKVKLEQKLLKN